MLEYNPSYAKSVETNEFYFLDTTRNAEEIKYPRRQVNHTENPDGGGGGVQAVDMLENVNATYNKGFAARKA